MQLILTKQELAKALGMRQREFDRRRRQMEAEGFPRPIAGCGARWSAAHVAWWVNRDVPPSSSPEGRDGAEGEGAENLPSAPVLAMQQRLEQRYGG